MCLSDTLRPHQQQTNRRGTGKLFYEGFGYQVLEAMACGTPVVASNSTSIPEVVGDAGLLCPPRDAEAFAEALRRVLKDEELAASLRQRGRARAAEFTWERTARDFAEALEAALA